LSRAVLKTHHLTGPRSFVRLRNRQLTSDAEVAWKCKYCYRCMHSCSAKDRYIFIPCRLCESPREAKRSKRRYLCILPARRGSNTYCENYDTHLYPCSGFELRSLMLDSFNLCRRQNPTSTPTSPFACITIISTNTPCLMQLKDSLQELQMKANSNPYLLESFPSDGDIYPNPNPRHKSRV
jgi:hypothetical protein